MLAPPVRPPGLLKRVYDAVLRPPAATPYREQGVSGTTVHSGYVENRERSPKWSGAQRYISISDMAVNTSIIAAGVHYFLNLIAHPQWTIEPADESSAAKEAAELVENAIHGMPQPWARTVRRAGTYRFYGFSIHEWTALKGKDGVISLASVETRPQHTIDQWAVADDGTVEGVWQRNPKTGERLGLPRSKLLYLVEDTLTDSPEGLGLFRHLAEPWERLKTYYKLETIAFERDLRGIPIGRVPYTLINEAVRNGELTQSEADTAVQAMEELVRMQVKQSDTSITLDSIPYYSAAADGAKVAGMPQWGLELLQGASAGVEALSGAIIRTQTEMARLLAAEHLMMGESSGNRALGEDKSRNLYLVANAVLGDIAAGVTNDIVAPLCLLNGIAEELYPKCTVEDVAFKDAEFVASVLQKMAAAGAVLSPDDEVVDDVRSLMGVSPSTPMSPEMAGLPTGDQPPTDEAASTAVDEAATTEPLPEGGGADEQRFVDAIMGKAARFDPTKHPHAPGGPTGGQFTSTGGGANAGGSAWRRAGWKDVEGDTVTAYHGASSTVLDKILKQGIKPGQSDQLAWVAREKSTAELFGSIAAKRGKPAVLLEVKVPKEHLGDFKIPGVGASAAFPGTIPPAWITGYALFDPKSGKAGKFKPIKVTKAASVDEEGTVYFTVVGGIDHGGDGEDEKDTKKAAPKTLYVKRQLLNGDQVREWAASQGIASALPAEDMHVTIAFSKEPVDWSIFSPDPYRVTALYGGPLDKSFDPSQPRDQDGKWSETGGGGGLLLANIVPGKTYTGAELFGSQGHPDYVFHGTSTEALASIEKSGLGQSGKPLYVSSDPYWAADEAEYAVEGDYRVDNSSGIGGTSVLLAIDKRHPSVANKKWTVDAEYIVDPVDGFAAHTTKTRIPWSAIHVIHLSGGPDDVTRLDELKARVVFKASVIGARSIHQFPARNTPNGALVLKFDCPELTRRWQYFRDGGASWDFPEYAPHVTLTYSVPEADVGAIELYTGPLAFGPEEWAEVGEGWAGDIREVPTDVVKGFDPSQPRDQEGKWTSTGNLSSDELAGLTRYTQHPAINSGLREGFDVSTPGIPTKEGKVLSMKEHSLDAMDSIMARSKTVEDMTVYRGLRRGFKLSSLGLKPGETFTDLGFMSTSLTQATANEFGGDQMKIVVPKGTKALYVGKKTNAVQGDQSELILNRGTPLRFLGKKGHVWNFEVIK